MASQGITEEHIERGRKGGLSRARRTSPADRSEDARRAVNARWEATKKA